MAKLNGTHTCKHCSHDFKWEAILLHKLSEARLPDVESVSSNVVASKVSFDEDKTIEFVSCYCPSCNRPLRFKYNIR
jgi:hypothetical protein